MREDEFKNQENERMAKLELLDKQIKDKQAQLDSTAQIRTNSAPSSGQDKNKDFFESEVRRLEAKLAEQRSQYEKQLQELQAKNSAEEYVDELMRRSQEKVGEPGKKDKDEKTPVIGLVMPIEEVMVVDQFADEINAEVGEVAFGIDSSYDWELANKLVKGQKMMNDYLDTVLAKTANDSNARIAFRKLRSRIYLATQ